MSILKKSKARQLSELNEKVELVIYNLQKLFQYLPKEFAALQASEQTKKAFEELREATTDDFVIRTAVQAVLLSKKGALKEVKPKKTVWGKSK